LIAAILRYEIRDKVIGGRKVLANVKEKLQKLKSHRR